MKRQKPLILSLLLTLLACTPPSPSETKEVLPHETRIKRIENTLYPIYTVRGQENPKSITTMMRENKISGLSMAFVDNGEVVWTKCYGYANVEDSIKVTPQTIFRAASLSKPLTAMAALHLVEQGLLELDQDINQKLTGWKPPQNEFTSRHPITLAQLIGHTAGIRNGVHSGITPDQPMPGLEDILSGKRLNAPAEVVAVPGEKHRYSNIGYMVLSELLQDVTSKDFHTLMDELVLEPCGMVNSTFEQNLPKKFKDHLAVGYDENQQLLPYYKHPSYGAGGLYSTPSDLGEFLATVLDAYHTENKNHTLISHNMARRVFEENSTKLGFNKSFENGNFVFRNDGSIPGYNCIIMGSVTKNQAVVIMLNTGSEPAYDFLNYLWRAVAMEYDWGLFEPEFYDPYTLPAEDLEKFSGLYTNSNDSLLFENRNGQLQVSDESLVPVGETSFIRPSIPIKYSFDMDSTGRVSRLYVRDERGDGGLRYRRVDGQRFRSETRYAPTH